MVKRWWDTSCKFCLTVRQFMIDLLNVLTTILVFLIIVFSGIGAYWIFLDNEPILHYGPNGYAEFIDDKIVFHLDATKLRDCPTTIQRKISGCGQIDLPESPSVTPVGERPPPVTIPLSLLFQNLAPQQLSGNVCTLVNVAKGYCNPAQQLLKLPIHTQSPPITFIPVPRTKTYSPPPH